MTHQEKVLAAYPKAACRKIGGEFWIENRANAPSIDALGKGKTAQAAWEHAARNVQRRAESSEIQKGDNLG